MTLHRKETHKSHLEVVVPKSSLVTFGLLSVRPKAGRLQKLVRSGAKIKTLFELKYITRQLLE
ncbi:MAG TPA: hypothetical protein DCS93_01585 [Microscillaceae bacterium]|nr:hypothetical protein [Microscillaceae bacterium]